MNVYKWYYMKGKQIYFEPAISSTRENLPISAPWWLSDVKPPLVSY